MRFGVPAFDPNNIQGVFSPAGERNYIYDATPAVPNSAGVIFNTPLSGGTTVSAPAGTITTVTFTWRLKNAAGAVFLMYTATVQVRLLRPNTPGQTQPTGELVSFSSSWSGSAVIVPMPEASWQGSTNLPYEHVVSPPDSGFDTFVCWSHAFFITNLFQPGDYAELSVTASHPDAFWLFATFPAYIVSTKPIPDFTALDEDGTVAFDASGTSLVNDTYNFVAAYDWNFGDGQTATDTDAFIEHDYDEEQTYNVNLKTTDKYGSFADITKPVAAVPRRIIGHLIDKFGDSYSAVKDPDNASNVQLYRFKNGVASRETIANIADAKNPRIQKDRHNTLHILTKNKTSGAWELRKSTNNGKDVS